MFAGAFMLGAQDRLLPPSVPFRFFAASVVYHMAGWAMLVVGHGDVVGFAGGAGPVLAGLHLITLGVLLMTAMGAAFQMLPVATRRPLGPVWACRLTWWLYCPGVGLLSAGLLSLTPWLLHVGLVLVVSGIGLFFVLVLRNLVRVSDLPQLTRHVGVALACLVGLVGLGVVLVADFHHGFLPDHGRVAAAHAVLAVGGTMGNLALGFSYILIPMFVLTQTVSAQVGQRTVVLGALALAALVAGMLADLAWLALAGLACALAAMGVYLAAMRQTMASRMRKRLESFFRLIWLAWAMMPLSVLIGGGALAGLVPDKLVPLWGWLAVFGWLLSFVTAVLQRVMPFLASMHSGSRGGKPVLMSRLVAERPLTVHWVAHGLAVGLVSAALVLANPLLALAGSVTGLAGSVALALFALLLVMRYRAHERAPS